MREIYFFANLHNCEIEHTREQGLKSVGIDTGREDAQSEKSGNDLAHITREEDPRRARKSGW